MRPPALSLWRPYPALIFNGPGKNVENRPWKTSYRGDLLIHAAKGWDGQALPFARSLAILAARSDTIAPIDLGAVADDVEQHPCGIIGVVELYDICTFAHQNQGQACGCPWWADFNQYHWRLRNAVAFPQPVPHPGSQGQWSVSETAWPNVFAQLKKVGRV